MTSRKIAKTLQVLCVILILIILMPSVILLSTRGLYDDKTLSELQAMPSIGGIVEGVDHVFFDSVFWVRLVNGDFRNAFNLAFNDSIFVNSESGIAILDAAEGLRLLQVSKLSRLAELREQQFTGQDAELARILRDIDDYQWDVAGERLFIYFESLAFFLLVFGLIGGLGFWARSLMGAKT